jgi:hypothetical protein
MSWPQQTVTRSKPFDLPQSTTSLIDIISLQTTKKQEKTKIRLKINSCGTENKKKQKKKD